MRKTTRTFKDTSMEIENIRRESFTTSRLTKIETELTIGDSMLGEVIISDETVRTGVTIEFSKSGDGERTNELSGHSSGNSSKKIDGEPSDTIVRKRRERTKRRRYTLTKRREKDEDTLTEDRDTITKRLRESRGEDDMRLTGLTITNDEFTLTLSNGEEDVNKTKTSMDTYETTRTALNGRRSTIEESLSDRRGVEE